MFIEISDDPLDTYLWESVLEVGFPIRKNIKKQLA